MHIAIRLDGPDVHIFSSRCIKCPLDPSMNTSMKMYPDPVGKTCPLLKVNAVINSPTLSVCPVKSIIVYL